jgi:2',3'-cyclic-nucleotide 2'-phosphodiesterase (5'-nucleotidase family)
VAIDRASGDVVAKAAAVPATGHAAVGAPDGETATLVRRYADRVAPLAKRVVGGTGTPLTRANGRLGALAAAAQRELAGTDAALVNPGSLRSDLDAGPLLYEQLFAVHPYDFPLLRLELRGAALAELLDGLRVGAADPGAYFAGPARIDPHTTYTVAANEWLATGPGFPALHAARRLAGSPGSETEALVGYVERRR